MKVVHITPAIAKEQSGPSYSVVRLCEALAAGGLDVTLATLDVGQSRPIGCVVKEFPFGCGIRRLGRSPQLRYWLEEECKAGRIDILHNHGMWQMNAIYPAWAASRWNVPLVWSPRGTLSTWSMGHGSAFKPIFWRLLQHSALRRAACFHVTAAAELEDVRRRGFYQPAAILPNAIDLSDLPIRRRDNQRTLLFLGRIHPQKGLENLIRAWVDLEPRYPNWWLRIVGSDQEYFGATGYLSALQAKVRSHGLSRIEFSGALFGATKLQAYRNADLFVLPSYSENFAMTVAESLSMETAVVVSKGAPWPSIQEHGAGWWVDVGVEPLLQCLQKAMSMPREVLDSMGARGRVWMRNEFDWQQVARRMNDVYAWLLSPEGNRPADVRI